MCHTVVLYFRKTRILSLTSAALVVERRSLPYTPWVLNLVIRLADEGVVTDMARATSESRLEELLKTPLSPGETVNPLREFGVGIDVHKRFVQVCVLVNTPDGVKRHEQEF